MPRKLNKLISSINCWYDSSVDKQSKVECGWIILDQRTPLIGKMAHAPSTAYTAAARNKAL